MKKITYKIDIFCEVNDHGAVIPFGSAVSIQDENGDKRDMTKYPTASEIQQIWIGQGLQYPLSYDN